MRAFAVVGVLIAAVLLGGCTSSGGAGGGSVADHENAPAAASGVAAGTGSGAYRDSSNGSGSKAQTTSLVDTRALIRTADLRIAVKSGTVSEQADRAGDIAASTGGSVYSDDRTTGSDATATLTLKVPPETLSDVLSQLAALGSVKSRTLSTQDVTQQVADVDSRVKSATDSIGRLRLLYDHATKVSDIIAIESELSSRESDLEALEAQQRTLDAQTSMATVHVYLITAPPAAPPKHTSHHHQHGIGGAFATGWHGFTAAAAWVARAFATALPFLVLLALVLVAGRYAWHRRPTPAPAPPEA